MSSLDGISLIPKKNKKKNKNIAETLQVLTNLLEEATHVSLYENIGWSKRKVKAIGLLCTNPFYKEIIEEIEAKMSLEKRKRDKSSRRIIERGFEAISKAEAFEMLTTFLSERGRNVL